MLLRAHVGFDASSSLSTVSLDQSEEVNCCGERLRQPSTIEAQSPKVIRATQIQIGSGEYLVHLAIRE